jgi:hypothetical protein
MEGKLNRCVGLRGCIQKFPDWPLGARLQMVQLSATRCSCIAILRVSLVSFVAITFCVASQRAFVVVYLVMTQSQYSSFTNVRREAHLNIYEFGPYLSENTASPGRKIVVRSDSQMKRRNTLHGHSKRTQHLEDLSSNFCITAVSSVHFVQRNAWIIPRIGCYFMIL